MEYLNKWLSANKYSGEYWEKTGGKRFYPSNSEKYLALNIDRFLHWHDLVNSIAAKLNWANALLLKIRNYVNTKTLRNIYFAILDSHLSYSCIVWAQHINAFSRLIILQKKSLEIMNFKHQLFYSSSFFIAKIVSWNLVIKLH